MLDSLKDDENCNQIYGGILGVNYDYLIFTEILFVLLKLLEVHCARLPRVLRKVCPSALGSAIAADYFLISGEINRCRLGRIYNDPWTSKKTL